ncbi:MAG: hypothetical protein GXY44_11000, partial [Phycisphaerales bacterium]|nr:hypothetical protein [Phycisphaerales bacterium]
RLSQLHRELEEASMWGNVEADQLARLREVGLEVRFFAVPSRNLGQVRADVVQELWSWPGKRVLTAIVVRSGAPEVPEGSEEIMPPRRGVDRIRAEAHECQATLEKDAQRLRQLAYLQARMQQDVVRLTHQAEYEAALRGGVGDDHLFALQGWVPADIAPTLETKLAEADIPSAMRLVEPAPDEQPPTLIRYPRLARPIAGLFDILGTVAGYREFDVSIAFMIALPLFAAMLTSDGGYGLVFLVGPFLMYRKACAALGQSLIHLVMVVGAASVVWGLLCGSFFGHTWYTPLIEVNLSEGSRILLMRISFILGAIHLCLAHLWHAVRLFPDLRFLNKVGWALIIWGMFGVVQNFVIKSPFNWGTPWPYLLLVGAALAVVFRQPSRRVFHALGVGLADMPLSILSAFSDVISYVRLMAVGLASTVLAMNFNEMAFDMPHWVLTVLVLVLGHALNLGLVMIALFAHGVRLNMLEFSNNLGMQWTGHPYKPFLEQTTQEH